MMRVEPAPVLLFGRFRLDTNRRELRRGDQPLDVAPMVFDTLVALVERRGRVAERAELIAALWPDRVVEDANLSQHVFVLRRLLREGTDDAPYIVTVPRRGYRFVREVREMAGPAATAESGHSSTPPRSGHAFPRRATRAAAAGSLIVAGLAVLQPRPSGVGSAHPGAPPAAAAAVASQPTLDPGRDRASGGLSGDVVPRQLLQITLRLTDQRTGRLRYQRSWERTLEPIAHGPGTAGAIASEIAEELSRISHETRLTRLAGTRLRPSAGIAASPQCGHVLSWAPSRRAADARREPALESEPR